MKAHCSCFYPKHAARFMAACLLVAGGVFCSCGGEPGSSKIIGDIQVYPDQILARGEPLGEVSVRVYLEGEDRSPVQGAAVTVFSSRNQDGDLVDTIVQPEQPTDADGLATAFIGSSTAGEVDLTAEVDGSPLCERYEDGQCVPAQGVVRFVYECEGGLVECNGACIDTQTDVDNCGGCGNVCEREHNDASCDGGACVIGECHPGWGDCNAEPADGCETDLLGDGRNCGACGNACGGGLTCIDGECSGACHDNDDDGFADEACGGTDCDDGNEDVYPGAEEVCNGLDDDCNGRVDQQPEASASCDDGDTCNGLERCFQGECLPGASADCNDGNDCTDDTCDPELGCQNVIMADGTSCGDPGMGGCDNPDTCLGGMCQPNMEPATTICREAAGLCDVDEYCDGVNPDCPPDEVQPGTLQCRDAAGECDAAEHCDGVNPACPPDALQPATVQCRPAAGACDAAETCDGVRVDCPADAVRAAGTVCRAAAGACDIAERCDGTTTVCPADAVESPLMTCRPSVGECDAAENCDGENAVCPPDADLPDGTPCTSDGVFCNGVEECRSGACSSPGNPCPDPSTCDEAGDKCGVCGDGVLSSGENCDPGSPRADHCCNPGSCTWVAYGQPDPQAVCSGVTECRADVCNGSGGCVAINVPDGTACGSPSDTACDNPDSCLGGLCRSNLEPATTVCRAQAGVCDVDERCDGVNPTCPPDAVQPPTTVCRPATGPCDVAERCDGVGASCPANGYAPSGTPCPDGDPCTDDTCNGSNVCVHVPAADPSANPGWECIEASCDGIDNDCDGCTDEGCGGGVMASVKVTAFSDGPGLRRISGNGQFGPAGRELPGKLVVQLNDGSGRPMPCEQITFTVEAAGKVCYGKGGRFVTSVVGTDPQIRRVCNDVGTSTLTGGPSVFTDQNGQASVGLVLADAAGTTAVSATAVSTGEKVFFVATAVARLSPTLTLPPPAPVENPALGPLDVTVGGSPSRTFMGNKTNYTLTIDGLSSSTGATNLVPSAPLASGGTLTITGTQFTDSQPVDGSCGGAPASGYPRVWIGGVQVTPTSVSNTQIVVPIPEGLPGAASVIVDDGTNTTFRSCTGCIPSVANATANLWRVPPSAPVFISAKTGSLAGSSVKVKVLALDSCGNALSLAGRAVTLWTENPNGTTPSTSVGVGAPDASGVATVSALPGGNVRAAFIGADVDGVATAGANEAVVVAVPILQPGAFSYDPALANDNGINSVVYRGGSQSGGIFDTVHINPAIRMQGVGISTYDINWMCTVGIIPACQCPATGTALSAACGGVFETEKNMVLGTVNGVGDMRNLAIGAGDVAVAGSLFLDLFGGYDMGQGGGGIMSVLSAQISYEVSISSGVKNVDGTVHSGWLRQTSAEQEIETNASGLELYNDRSNSDPADDEIRNVVLRVLLQRAMP
jgi:hypothetical protein